MIFVYFCAINFGYCAEDFFFDSGNTKKSSPKTLFKKERKWWFFNKKNDNEPQQGYSGVLPNIEDDFKYKKQSTTTQKQDMIIPEEKNIEEENLKQAPFNDALFLDVIVKKEKSSNYVNDLQRTKFALNNLKKCIENKEDIQRFNACVNMVDMYVKNLQNKYQDTSTSLKESYIDILNTNYYAKLLGNLKYDSNYYSQYIPTSQGKYSKSNIEQEEEKLLNRINKTLFLINNEA